MNEKTISVKVVSDFFYVSLNSHKSRSLSNLFFLQFDLGFLSSIKYAYMKLKSTPITKVQMV